MSGPLFLQGDKFLEKLFEMDVPTYTMTNFEIEAIARELRSEEKVTVYDSDVED